jgi:hypothetical protein
VVATGDPAAPLKAQVDAVEGIVKLPERLIGTAESIGEQAATGKGPEAVADTIWLLVDLYAIAEGTRAAMKGAPPEGVAKPPEAPVTETPPKSAPPAKPPEPPAVPKHRAPLTTFEKPPKFVFGEIKSVQSFKAAIRKLNYWSAQYNPKGGLEAVVTYDANGNVFLHVREADGFQKMVFEGQIGTVDPANLPKTPYGQAEFGNAIESHVLEIVNKATGQHFPTKHANATGPDLVPH